MTALRGELAQVAIGLGQRAAFTDAHELARAVSEELARWGVLVKDMTEVFEHPDREAAQTLARYGGKVEHAIKMTCQQVSGLPIGAGSKARGVHRDTWYQWGRVSQLLAALHAKNGDIAAAVRVLSDIERLHPSPIVRSFVASRAQELTRAEAARIAERRRQDDVAARRKTMTAAYEEGLASAVEAAGLGPDDLARVFRLGLERLLELGKGAAPRDSRPEGGADGAHVDIVEDEAGSSFFIDGPGQPQCAADEIEDVAEFEVPLSDVVVEEGATGALDADQTRPTSKRTIGTTRPARKAKPGGVARRGKA